MKLHIFGCPECGSELTKAEVKRERGECKFCGNKDLEDFGLQNISKEDCSILIGRKNE